MFYDITIVGGGITGSILAILLSRVGFKVLLLEKNVIDITKDDERCRPHLRVLAINDYSVKLLKYTGVWKNINKDFCTSYHRLETWEYLSSLLVFDSSYLNLTQLGYIIENSRLQVSMWKTFYTCKSLTAYYASYLTDMEYCKKIWNLKLNNGKTIRSYLLIGADGINSQIRQHAGIIIKGWQYSQSCMLLSVELEHNDNHGVIWQVFTPSGPKGFLPLYNNWGVLMWYDDSKNIHDLMQLPVSLLEKKIQDMFFQKLGKIKILQVGLMPLVCYQACDYVKHGIVLVGDAAHSINPLGGQGANMGLRDVKTLSDILSDSKYQNEFWYDIDVLERYQQYRKYDNLLMQLSMDFVYTLFSNDKFLCKKIRNLGIDFIKKNKILKKYILKYALGLY